ncbi:hypothetical protein GIB67_005354 [Kingdonia uniflora]|uniref:Uncharacterized protein n=1 Tax=Kingdonia uniflora TaxID=39325 RepID=A0A7J7NCU5_9MAGN|nr:hypothetical protein GIB67_005354 [Kingdonia uniflora]
MGEVATYIWVLYHLSHLDCETVPFGLACLIGAKGTLRSLPRGSAVGFENSISPSEQGEANGSNIGNGIEAHANIISSSNGDTDNLGLTSELGGFQGCREGGNQKPFGPRRGKGFKKSWTPSNAKKEKKTDQGSTCFNCGDTRHWARVATSDRVQTYQAVGDTNSARLEFAASDFFDDTNVVMDQHTE